MLRSEESVSINGSSLKRWAAERAGLIPVSISRNQRFFKDQQFSNSASTFFPFRVSEYRAFFPKNLYLAPVGECWKGFISQVENRNGVRSEVLSVWPQLLPQDVND